MHAFVQLPQCWPSVVVSTHVPPQSVRPPAQVQVPDAHARLLAHIVVQSPQCAESRVVSTQLPLHAVSPLGQSVAHVPAEQTCAAVQLVVHAPQCAGSFVTSTQSAPHGVSPIAHVGPLSRPTPPSDPCVLASKPSGGGGSDQLVHPTSSTEQHTERSKSIGLTVDETHEDSPWSTADHPSPFLTNDLSAPTRSKARSLRRSFFAHERLSIGDCAFYLIASA